MEQYINETNEMLAETGASIFLYLVPETMEHEVNGSFYVPTDWQGERMLENNRVASYMNIHFCLQSNGNINGDGFGGTANFPWNSANYAFAFTTRHNVQGDFAEDRVSILTHELGHALGLFHTHQARFISTDGDNGSVIDPCFQEPVSRTRRVPLGCIFRIGRLMCEVNGDVLRTTPGDPGLSRGNEQDDDFVTPEEMGVLGCQYINPTQDNWGAQWQPDIRNIMSNSQRACRDNFTWQQVNLMYKFLEEQAELYTTEPMIMTDNRPYFYINPHIDRFENDNFWQNANDFNMEGLQFHSFHYDPHPAAVSQAETDWVQFRPQPGEEFFVATAPVQGADAPNNMQVRIYRGIQAPLFAICHAFT